MTKKQQKKLKRQFSYLKQQFKKLGLEEFTIEKGNTKMKKSLKDLSFEDLGQKSFSTLNRMRASMLRISDKFEGKKVSVTRFDRVLLDGKIFNLSNFKQDEFIDYDYFNSKYPERSGSDGPWIAWLRNAQSGFQTSDGVYLSAIYADAIEGDENAKEFLNDYDKNWKRWEIGWDKVNHSTEDGVEDYD
ncbi:MAG: hypothetical protein U0K91_02375 [Acutalibacteraceae bacterium]|nr:hypothetical protein [Acutalibacteraceae bacterium]